MLTRHITKLRRPILQPQHPLTRGLIGAWLFNEGGGGIARDYSGRNNSAQASGSYSWQIGPEGFEYDPASGSYMDTNVNPLLGLTHWTIVCRLRGTTTGSDQAFLCANNANTNSIFGIYTSGGKWLYFWDGSGRRSNIADTDIFDGDIHTVAWSDDGTQYTPWLDGEPDTGIASGTFAWPSYSSIRFFRRIDGNYNSYPNYALAYFLYNRALIQQEQIQLHLDPYQLFRAPFPGLTLKAIAATTSTVQLTWTDNSENETGYSIERSTTSATAGFSEIDTVGAGVTTYDDSGLAADTYWYRVRALNAMLGNSEYSNVVETTVS